ncbi:protein 5NUC-like [Lycorma delicatula]|uniref:protein 5NUC-like n=1 Tax=Lycorma delicatula TaxID=130591 RepID=UPI003F50F383
MRFLLSTALFIRLLKLSNTDFNLVVLHTNDMHARYEECNRKGEPCTKNDIKENHCYGGFPRIHYLSKKIKEQAYKEGKSVILVNAGDMYLGSNYHSAFIWEVASDMMNQLNFDAMCLGNHEFDDGVENLVPFIEHVNFPIVCCNIEKSKEEALNSTKNLYPSYILNVNGTSIGIIGYITQKTKTISRPGKVNLLDEIRTIKKEVAKLKEDGIKIIMVLGHAGIEMDIEIVKNIPEVDFVIGGHSHTFLYTGIPPQEFAERHSGIYPKVVSRDNGSTLNIPIAHAYAFTRYLGQLELTFDDDGNIKDFSGNPILLDMNVKEDELVKEVLNMWKDKLLEKEKEFIGKTEVVLEGGNVPCRYEECNMGNLITDAFIEYNKKRGFKETGIAIYPAGGIRSGINTTSTDGIINTGDLMRVLPFRDRVYQTELQGKYFKEVLEHSVYHVGRKYRRGEFLQFAGVKVVYNLSMPEGQRVQSALVQPKYQEKFEEINNETIYTIILPDCLSHGSDGYSMFPDHSIVNSEIAKSVYDLVKDYIKVNSPIKIQNSGRITVLNNIPQSQII